MDERTRFVGLVLLGVLGTIALVAIAACAVTSHDVPPVLVAVVSGVLGAIVAFVPPSSGGRLDELSAYNHQAKHDIADALNALNLKIERLLAVQESQIPRK